MPPSEVADREDVLLLMQFLPAPELLAPPAGRPLCASLPALHLPDSGPPGRLPLPALLLPGRPAHGSVTELWRPGRRRDRLLVPTYRVSDLSLISPGVSDHAPPPRADTRERPCPVQEGLRRLERTSLSDRFPVTYRIQIRPKPPPPPPAAPVAANGRV